MNIGFYPKLAWDGIRKNKRLYLPYILTCSGMILMFYIIHYLAAMPTLKEMPAGSSTTQILGLGVWVVAFFALIFLIYTNSFLMRRRQKEFGLYNILGMGKSNIRVLLLCETVIIFVLSLVIGLLGGVLLSKLAELCLVAVIDGKVTYTLSINFEALLDAVLFFALTFAVIFIKGLITLNKYNAASLLKSENVGEKPPKANYVLGLIGIVVLVGAYYIAFTIKSPLSALSLFFVAVLMVIAATYLIFISGSVMLCKLLQKNKRYYYKKNHFVSVSSMVYRMKRNGAGLASICILCTMVLVMMMGAGSLFFGKEDSLKTRYPYDFTVNVDYCNDGGDKKYSKEKEDFILNEVDAVLKKNNAGIKASERYLFTSVTGLLYDGTLALDPYKVNAVNAKTLNYVTQIFTVPLDDYNRCMGANEELAENEVLIYCMRRTYNDPVIDLGDGTVLNVKKHIDSIMGNGDAALNMIPSVFIVTPDIEKCIESFNKQLSALSEDYFCRPKLMYSFDTGLPSDKQISLNSDIREHLRELDISGEGGFYTSSVECREAERNDFYGTYGGIFYLGIILSIVFLAATVLIIYYKQISEGYEDESRFEIMRKVGMTSADIKKSINSQMLTVFFLPIITAAFHIGFAFPMVQKLLALFNLRNTLLSLIVTSAAFVIFGVFYAIVYRITSNAYYSIVSGKNDL